jgi:hypothetical protein
VIEFVWGKLSGLWVKMWERKVRRKRLGGGKDESMGIGDDEKMAVKNE